MRTFLVANLASILHSTTTGLVNLNSTQYYYWFGKPNLISTFASMSIFIFRVLLTGDIVEVSCVWVSVCISIVSGI